MFQCEAVDHTTLRDPQADSERVQQAEWLVVLGKLLNNIDREKHKK